MKYKIPLIYLTIIIIVTLLLFFITKYAVYMSAVNCPCGPCSDGYLMDTGLLKLTTPNSGEIYAKYCNLSSFYLIYSLYWLIISTIIAVISVSIYKYFRKK